MNAEMWGFVAGLVVSVAAVCIGSWVRRRKEKKRGVDWDDSFDERQKLARGKACGSALFTLTAYLVINAVVSCVRGPWAQPGVDGMMGIFPATGVFAMRCICSDAFISLREKPRTYLSLFGMAAIVQILATAVSIHDGTLFTDGLADWKLFSPVCGVLFLVLFGAMLLKMRHDRNGDGEEA